MPTINLRYDTKKFFIRLSSQNTESGFERGAGIAQEAGVTGDIVTIYVVATNRQLASGRWQDYRDDAGNPFATKSALLAYLDANFFL